MKLKITLLDEDSNYIKKIVGVFNTKYSDKVEVYSFTEKDKAFESLKENKSDVFLINQNINVDLYDIPEECIYIYLVEENGIDYYKEHHAICKYQKVENIYKQILNIYSDKAFQYKETRVDNSDMKIVMFTSFSGGVGSSTLAVAYSINMSMHNKKVLYLNFETNGDSERFFSGNGQFTFSDVIYALKSGKSNLIMKIESSVKKSQEGVDFFSAPLEALDMVELNKDDIETLINELKNYSKYECVVIDINFNFGNIEKYIWEVCDDVVVVSDGSDIANDKFKKTYKSIDILHNKNVNINPNKIKLIYNKFSNKTSRVIRDVNVVEIGGIPKFEHATTQQVIAQVNRMNVFEKVM